MRGRQLLSYCSVLLKTSQSIVWHVFTCFLTGFDWFEAISNSQNFRLFGRKGREKFFEVWKQKFEGWTIPTTIWKHIYNISKVQIRREKKVGDSGLDVRFFQNILGNPKFEFTNPTKKVGSRFQTRKTPRIWLLHVFSRTLTNLCQFLAKRIAQSFFSKFPRFLFKNWRSD